MIFTEKAQRLIFKKYVEMPYLWEELPADCNAFFMLSIFNIDNSTFPPIKLMQMLELSSKKCNKFLY